MDQKLDILEREDFRKNPCRVPAGYFDDLRQRLSGIPREAAGHRVRKSFPDRAVVGVLAGGLAAALAVGVLVFRPGKGVRPAPGSISYEQYASADLIPRTDPFIYYADEVPQVSNYTQEELLEYLLESRNEVFSLNEWMK